MRRNKKETLPKVIGKVILGIVVAYAILVGMFLYTSDANKKIAIKQVQDLSELYIEQINRELSSINVELVYSLLQNESIQMLPDVIGPEQAGWYFVLNNIVDSNRNLRLRYGSRYQFYVYDKDSELLILDTAIYFKQSSYKSPAASALLEKQKKASPDEWDYLEADGVDYIFNSYEVDRKVIGYVLNIHDFLEDISLENMGYKIVPYLHLGERVLSINGLEEQAIDPEYQVYTYDIVRLGELQLAVRPDEVMQAYQKMQFLVLAGILCVLILIIFCIERSYFKILIPMKEFMNKITGTMNGVYRENSLMELSAAGKKFDDLWGELKNLRIALYEKELEEQEMELEYLKEQIRPHFFLNCLNLIYGMAEKEDSQEVLTAVGALSEYMRYMFKDSHSFRSLAEEVEHIQNYLQICRLRYKEVLEFQCMVEEEAKECRIPALLLQAFVENSVKHAASIDGSITISLYAAKELRDGRERLYVSISDTGKGFREEILDAIHRGKPVIYDGREHIGIRNSMQRLKIIYQGDAHLEISNMSENYGAVIEIFIPWEGMANESVDCG